MDFGLLTCDGPSPCCADDVYVSMDVVDALAEELEKAENMAKSWQMVAEYLMGVKH